jgi:uncharacterized membrane protein YccC
VHGGPGELLEGAMILFVIGFIAGAVVAAAVLFYIGSNFGD